jgi:nucleoside-diphosphate-sugar epimerase
MASMKVAVTGATGVLGAAAVRALVAAGHQVRAVVRSPAKARLVESWGAAAAEASVFDADALAGIFEGCDAVCSLAARMPVGLRSARSAAWHEHDRLRTEGVRQVVRAAREAHVRRVVQESTSLLYADQGEAWIDESSPLLINTATEPACVAELQVQEFQSDLRQGVVLRFGSVIGDDPRTRFWLRGVRIGRPIGYGAPDGWIHPVHTDDLGSAVVAALGVPGGIFNVGAEPVRRRELLQGYATAVGRQTASSMGPVMRLISGSRSEPYGRSLRVTSERFGSVSGWVPTRRRFDVSWLAPAMGRDRVSR